MMRNANVADEAKRMTDAELAATIAVYQGEQQRRTAIPPDQRPSERAERIARERHERLFGLGTF